LITKIRGAFVSKSINIVDKNNVLIASITDGNIIFKGDYKIIETDDDEKCFRDNDGKIEVIKPEVSA